MVTSPQKRVSKFFQSARDLEQENPSILRNTREKNANSKQSFLNVTESCNVFLTINQIKYFLEIG